MRVTLRRLARVLLVLLACVSPIRAQLRPQVTTPPRKAKKKPATQQPAKPTQILVRTSPNAEVYLDDQFSGRASPEGRLVIPGPKPGSHALRVSVPGKQDFLKNVNVVAGETSEIQATLADLPAQIAVVTSPGAEVYLDDQYVGRASANGRLAFPNARTGKHNLRVSLTGKKDYLQDVTVVAGQETRVEAVLADIEKPGPRPGQVGENAKDGLKYVWIPPGSFEMGCSPGDSECSSDEKPSHQVTITKGFWLGQTEVTVGAYKRFAGAAGRQMPAAPSFNSGWANDNMPIVNVSWDDAQAYCTWAGGRLPTEAEWEYAARAGSTEARYGPLDDVAWYNQNSESRTHDVAQKRANGFGLYDMLGNVWEWVNDWYEEKHYQSSASQNPPGPSSGQYRVLRGGSWNGLPRDGRVSVRNRLDPAFTLDDFGIRCGGEVISP